MIELKDIYKSFAEKEVLHGVSACFEAGKCNMIIGGSGSGKTVLMKCIVGLMEPTKGQILYDNRSFTDLKYKEKRALRQELGMLFQYSALFDSMTVEDNVIFPLRLFTRQSRRKMQDRVNFCLERVNLDPKVVNKLFPDEISGGMKKRVGIARAMAMNPKYLFCDEPNSGLDPLTSGVIDRLIKEITQEFNTTTIINTHDMNSVMEIGDHVVYINKGNMKFQGSVDALKETEDEELKSFVYATQFSKDGENHGPPPEEGVIEAPKTPKVMTPTEKIAITTKPEDVPKDGNTGGRLVIESSDAELDQLEAIEEAKKSELAPPDPKAVEDASTSAAEIQENKEEDKA